MPSTVLAIDPASCTGWAAFTLAEDDEVRLHSFGAIEVDKSCTLEGDKMLSLRGQVAQLLDSLPPPVVAAHVETYYFSRRCCNGAALNLVLRAALYQLLCERRIPYTLHGPSHWKRFVAGSATPSKADVQAFGKAKAAKAFVVAALARKYGIHFPTRVRVGHRHLAFKTDISDAVAIGIYGMTSARPAVRVQPYDGREPEVLVDARAPPAEGSSDEA